MGKQLRRQFIRRMLVGIAGLLLMACQGGKSNADVVPARSSEGLKAGPALWHDPQLAPHPAYGFATSSHPPAGVALPDYWEVPAAPAAIETIVGLEHLARGPDRVRKAAGLAVFGSLVALSGFGDATALVDISDPSAPRFLAEIPGSHRGAQFIAYPSGRLLLVLVSNAQLPVWDVSNPRRPRQITELFPPQGGHNIGVVPGTPILYNAGGSGGGAGISADDGDGFTEIYNFSDPDRPRLETQFSNGYSCHDIRFWIDPVSQRYRATCAGIEFTQIWDIADPLNPEVILSLPVHHGVSDTPSTAVTPVVFSHFAALNAAGDVLIVGDETGGGIAPGCGAHADTTAGGVSTPTGALYFYALDTETTPRLMGWFSPTAHLAENRQSLSCTAHFGRLVPDPAGRDLLAMGFYGAGVILIDFSNPILPLQLDQMALGYNTWEVWYHNGYLISGDLSRGMDVLQLR